MLARDCCLVVLLGVVFGWGLSACLGAVVVGAIKGIGLCLGMAWQALNITMDGTRMICFIMNCLIAKAP